MSVREEGGSGGWGLRSGGLKQIVCPLLRCLNHVVGVELSRVQPSAACAKRVG